MADVPTPGSAPLRRRISYDPYTAKPSSNDIQGGRLMGMPSVWQRRRSRKIRRERLQALQRIGLATSGSPVTGETALCIAYMCPWAHACGAATPRPALVSQRKCHRKYPDEMRPRSGLSAHALDLLAHRRQKGVSLSPITTSMLEQFRPGGPSSSLGKKKPAMPVLEGSVQGQGNYPAPRIA